MDKDDPLQELREFVEESDSEVSVAEIANYLECSSTTARRLAKKGIEKGVIEGQKTVPIIGYSFGGNGQLEVLTTREEFIRAVAIYAEDQVKKAKSKESLDELRDFVRTDIAEDAVPVEHAWRFSPVSN